ncbi:phage holin family protein [Flagellimonas baculiformis]|uniref:phage holin family protein n=1 Tax=Flagellimonas baculiformis TaxID=3067310 RepID=UPI00296FB78F|nr:phage holin family protein [Muricauda sp. D6]
MSLFDIKEHIKEAEDSTRSYVDSSLQYYRLKSFKSLMQGITVTAKALFIGAMAAMALLFLSIAASFWIGDLMDSNAGGFLVVGGFYVLMGFLLYVFRKRLEAPLLRTFSEFYFDWL